MLLITVNRIGVAQIATEASMLGFTLGNYKMNGSTNYLQKSM